MNSAQRSARVVLVMSVLAARALGQVAPSLGTAADFAVLGGSAVTNIGPSYVTGALGVSPGSALSGFAPATVVGAVHAADAVALGALSDTATAFLDLGAQACGTTYADPAELGGQTLGPGVYCFSSSAQLTGTLTLDGRGDPDAVWVFKTVSTLVTASNANVLLTAGAQSCNVFWQVGGSATLGSSSGFVGNILALGNITLGNYANLSGRALARHGAVALDANTVSLTTCGVQPSIAVRPTLGETFSPARIAPRSLSTLTITLSNPGASAASLTVPLVDVMPSGLSVSGTASNSCGGLVTTSSSMVTLSGGTIPIRGTCTVTVPVSANAAGAYFNSISAGALQTTQGSNAAPAAAILSVVAPVTGTLPGLPPMLTEVFQPSSISAGGTSLLTITLTNGSNAAANLIAPLTDYLPTGLLISGAARSTCGGTLTSISGGSSLRLTGGAIPAAGSCTVSVNVTAATPGSYCNKLGAEALKTDQGSNESETQAIVSAHRSTTPPSLRVGFRPANITSGHVSILTITLGNPNSAPAKLASPLTDSLPNGVVVSGSASTTCGGTLIAAVNSWRVILSGGIIPARGFCTVTVEVTAVPRYGAFNHKLPAGTLKTDLGHNLSAATATLTVRRVDGWR